MLWIVIKPCICLTVDEIYHLAASAAPYYYLHNPIKTIKTNTIGTGNVLGMSPVQLNSLNIIYMNLCVKYIHRVLADAPCIFRNKNMHTANHTFTTCIEQFKWVRHRLLVTSYPQEISKDLVAFIMKNSVDPDLSDEIDPVQWKRTRSSDLSPWHTLLRHYIP